MSGGEWRVLDVGGWWMVLRVAEFVAVTSLF